MPILHARNPLFLLVLFTFCLVSVGCDTVKTSDKDLKFIDPAQAEQLVRGESKLLGLAGKTTGLFVDPRGPTAFNKGHIPNAVNLPFSRVADEHESLKSYSPLIIYGSDYGDDLPNAMSKRLRELGHKDVRTLKGGLRAWEAAGNPIEQGNAAANLPAPGASAGS